MSFLHPTHPRETVARAGLPRRIGALAVALLLALSTWIGTGHATSLELEGTADLLQKSDSVITGRVLSTEARMREDHQFIYTYVTIEVDDVLKGSAAQAGRTIVLEELGGQVGDWVHYVEAVPRYAVGERVLAFLEDRDEGLFRTYGMIQGKFRFETDARTGEEMLTRPAEWTDAYFAAFSTPRDLTVVRADGSYAAESLLTSIREWIAVH